jgi:predicted metalloprotease
MILALAAALSIVAPADCASAQAEPLRQALGAVLETTTRAWAGAFAEQSLTYSPPRLSFLCPPVGHPSRGSGYFPGLGLVLDLGDFAGLQQALPEDADGISELIIAHEVGHHVQRLMGRQGAGKSWELQADCYAGWWLARDKRAPAPDQIGLRLAKGVTVLSALQTGAIRLAGDASDGSHGSLDERLAAITGGLAALTPWAC